MCSALVVSKINYMLPLYGGMPDYLVVTLQKKLTEAMRVVTRRKWNVPGQRLTSTAELLQQCGYLSVKQMVFYHSVVMVHKVLVHQAPLYLYHVVLDALSSGVQHQYPTRSAGTRQVAPARLEVANTSWRWRAARQYAALPTELKREGSMPRFLARLREYSRCKVAI